MAAPSQSVPGGCVIGFLAIIPAMACGLGCWGLIKWATFPLKVRSFDDRFWILAATVGVGALATLLLLVISVKALRATDFRGYDSRDPDRKNLKW